MATLPSWARQRWLGPKFARQMSPTLEFSRAEGNPLPDGWGWFSARDHQPRGRDSPDRQTKQNDHRAMCIGADIIAQKL